MEREKERKRGGEIERDGDRERRRDRERGRQKGEIERKSGGVRRGWGSTFLTADERRGGKPRMNSREETKLRRAEG